ncbi:MAG: dihydroorotate dehydrogenase [Candidatus Methanomethylophilaceae archaeon]|jgi:dihydroorotate dehydrogenase (NAD+) catalytic subunit
MGRLSVSVGKLKLEHPGMVASGIMDETGESMVRMIESGAGAVVTKSIGSVPRKGHGNPTFTEVAGGFVNAMGLPNPGIEEFAEEMEIAVRAGPIIGSVFGSNAEEFAFLAGKMEDMKASAVELNLSCPHAAGYGAEIGSDPKNIEKIVSAVCGAVKIPVWAKLTPNTSSVADLGRAAENGGADAVVAINTLKAMVISPELKRPVLSNRFGGLSGPAVKPVGVRAVYDLRTALSIPVVGVGGISHWRDAAEYMMAGACAFQIGSAVGTKGPEVFSEINKGLELFAEEQGYGSLEEMVGAAHA